MKLVIKNGSLINENGNLEIKHMYIDENGMITKISDELVVEDQDKVIDAEGLLVSPGFIDVHIHLREPGGEHKETIETGTKAASKGGFTTVCAMPNTKPVPDNSETLEWLHHRFKESSKIRVYPYGSITKNLEGNELNNFQELASSGAFAFTDDGVGVQTADMMYQAMLEAAKLNKSIVAHCEDLSLVHSGVVHEGKVDKRLHLNGISSLSESVQIARDVLLAEKAGCHYHVCHISTKESVRIVRDAKRAGINVTAEVTPHHLLLSEEDIISHDPNFKMNPPLRSVEDREALIEGLLDGTIDMIATDHAPHAKEEKDLGMERAPFGIVGLETAFPLLYTHLVEKGILTLQQLIMLLTGKPAEIFQFPTGKLQEGSLADIVLIDLKHEQIIDPTTFVSKGKNTPFTGWKCKGWPVTTIVGGEIVWERERVNQ
ncbi:dihydroorotase [Bacillus andreraoultii]|uniref:dihydroorotase n=1 Tax=Bacillus andreraoultii TaxID=1499685 RepID=UPI00053BB588|nr:dihydroorotase [Bacillus andreraoultii]